MRTVPVVLLSASLCVAAACRDSHTGDDTNPDTPLPGELKIQDVQNDSMAPGSPVELHGVVVTAIDAYGGKTGDIWIEEPEGGPYSGVHVYNAPLDQVAQLALGDIIDLKGAIKDEYTGPSTGPFDPGMSITELKPASMGSMSVTKVSSGTPLSPQVVDALAIGQLATPDARNAEWEKWEGVLIQVNNVAAVSAPACVGSACSDMTLYKFTITGGIIVESSLAAFPMPAIARGDCLAGVTGVVDYFYDYQILPRTTTEVATGGTSCPSENTAAQCTDGLDNDGNGFTDCNDNACVLVEATCHPPTTISAIQTAGSPPTGGVQLTDVYVAAMSKNKKNIWVQTGLTAASNEGIYVYGPGSLLDIYPVGSKVTIIGTVAEFNDNTGTETLTELKALSVTAGSAGTGTVVPVATQNVTALSAEGYESVLVTLTNVKITTVGTSATYGVGAAEQYPGALTFKTDDDIALPIGPATTCYASVTGVWTYLVYENAWGLLPLSSTGTGTGTCL